MYFGCSTCTATLRQGYYMKLMCLSVEVMP